MRVLVLNSGSSSIKHRLFDLARGDAGPVASGLVERIGEAGSRVEFRHGDRPAQAGTEPVPDHAAGFTTIIGALERAGLAAGLDAIGHRVVHGGEEFTAPTLVDADVVERIRAQIPLAPLHNPGNLEGIEVAAALRGDLPQVAVFDTAFHRTLPPRAFRYAVPERLYTDHGVRRYGFHGTSHAYVTRRAAAHLGRPPGELAIVSLHLGNGASAAAVDGGRSVETSMGLSPLEGLVMGTRSGDLDPAVVFHLVREAGMAPAEVERLLNRESGLRGLCGDNDVREVEERAEAGDAAAALALDVYCHRIRKYVGAYAAVLGRLDAVVFTAGVGQHSETVRARVCRGLDLLGITVDPARNAAADVRAGGDVAPVHRDDGRVAVLAVATDEEREIALQTRERLRGSV